MERVEIISGEDFALIPKSERSPHWKEVEGVIDLEKFNVSRIRTLMGVETCICYGEVPLWRTIIPLESVDIFLAPPEEAEESYTLICLDCWGDAYTYGCWKTLEAAKEWLANPQALY